MERCELKTETVIGIYKLIKNDQIEEADARVKIVLPRVCQQHVARCLELVCLLLEQTQQICKTNKQFARITGLLVAYANVFSWCGPNRTHGGFHSSARWHPNTQASSQASCSRDGLISGTLGGKLHRRHGVLQ